MPKNSRITRISGPVAEAENLTNSFIGEVVEVGEKKIIGEIVRISGKTSKIQLYEDTTGLCLRDEVRQTGRPLSVYLGPWLIGGIFDGIQRPLSFEGMDYIGRGMKSSIPQTKFKLQFMVEEGDSLKKGDVIAQITETPRIVHRITSQFEGTVSKIHANQAAAGEPILTIDAREVTLGEWWPVRIPRPFGKKMLPNDMLFTGQRVIDTFFPLLKGGSATLPGGFGAGKTIIGHQLARWASADVVVYIGCGERGNEMADLLEKFSKDKEFLDKTVFVVNTSNMPVAAREASMFTGITISEYYRDMGYDVFLMADSTSRWAEALRETHSSLGEMPGEKGFPPDLNSRLASFYERAGHGECLGNPRRTGSVTLVGAVSPPGADFSEPVTQATMQFTKVLWSLDTELAYKRHFPAINWLESYSKYVDAAEHWWRDEVSEEWYFLRGEALRMLEKEERLQSMIEIVGVGELSEEERMDLDIARMLREAFLQQSALDKIDSYCTPAKQFKMLEVIMEYGRHAGDLIRKYNISSDEIKAAKVREDIERMRSIPDADFDRESLRLKENIFAELDALADKGGGRI
jgi:V/A-type H+-transporting ATPase subunit A